MGPPLVARAAYFKNGRFTSSIEFAIEYQVAYGEPQKPGRHVVLSTSLSLMQTPAEEQFHTSSRFSPPLGYKAWQIRNDYPRSDATPPPEEKPWLKVDFESDSGAERYCNLVKEYCFKGNTNNKFIVQKNMVVSSERVAFDKLTDNPRFQDRKWYHPPWLHYGDKGREPINGLAFGGFLDPGYLTKTQNHWVQAWLCSYFNWEGQYHETVGFTL